MMVFPTDTLPSPPSLSPSVPVLLKHPGCERRRICSTGLQGRPATPQEERGRADHVMYMSGKTDHFHLNSGHWSAVCRLGDRFLDHASLPFILNSFLFQRIQPMVQGSNPFPSPIKHENNNRPFPFQNKLQVYHVHMLGHPRCSHQVWWLVGEVVKIAHPAECNKYD